MEQRMNRSNFLQWMVGSWIGGVLVGGFLQKVVASSAKPVKPIGKIVPSINPLAIPRTNKGPKSV